MDTTPNQRKWAARTLEQAAGRRLGEPEAQALFRLSQHGSDDEWSFFR